VPPGEQAWMILPRSFHIQPAAQRREHESVHLHWLRVAAFWVFRM
jgi:hypothetical protein